MNPVFLAASLDNLLVLVALVLLSAASSWLTKRRAGKEAGADETELSPSSETQERSTRELDLDEALRQLLTGEPASQAPPPLNPSARREEQPELIGSDEESVASERPGANETRASSVSASERVNPPVAPLQPCAALAPATAAFDKANEPCEGVARHCEGLDAPPPPPAAAAHRRYRRTREGAEAVALVRDARTVRSAFLASLILGPPKALEN